MITLSTHVLDTSRGTPALAVAIELFSIDGGLRTSVARVMTNDDGRTDRPIGSDLAPGSYELVFHVGSYFATYDVSTFYSEIAVRFTLDARSSKYHVPLLISPWGYSTYRGS